MNDDVLICRCEEVTRREIVQAIRDGAHTVDGIKRRTRAGMGLCQSKTCGRLIQRILAEELQLDPAEVEPIHSRMPVRPITVGKFKEE